jgi:hypothetical protein
MKHNLGARRIVYGLGATMSTLVALALYALPASAVQYTCQPYGTLCYSYDGTIPPYDGECLSSQIGESPCLCANVDCGIYIYGSNSCSVGGC